MISGSVRASRRGRKAARRAVRLVLARGLRIGAAAAGLDSGSCGGAADFGQAGDYERLLPCAR